MKKLKSLIVNLLKFEWVAVLYNFMLFRLYKVDYDEFPIINGRIKVVCKGNIKIGKGLRINSGTNHNPIGGDTVCRLIANTKEASISIGNNVGISNTTLFCSDSIIIEDDVLIGGSCKIYDTDFHSINYYQRKSAFIQNIPDENAKKSAVIIKEGAWIGGHCILLKGVVIGKRVVVGAGSVVTKNIPDNEIWAGNPAKCIKR